MKGSRFSEEQIIGVLRESEAGAKTEEVCRRHGISSATFYKWKAKYGGLELSEAKRLKGLEDENRRLKKLLATVVDTSLSGVRVVRELDRLTLERATPRTIVSDNGTELTSIAVLRWAITGSSGTTSSPASRSGMPSSRASTANYAMSV